MNMAIYMMLKILQKEVFNSNHPTKLEQIENLIKKLHMKTSATALYKRSNTKRARDPALFQYCNDLKIIGRQVQSFQLGFSIFDPGGM